MERWHLTPFAMGSFLVLDKMMRWWAKSGQRFPLVRFTFESGDKHVVNSSACLANSSFRPLEC